MSVDRTVVKHRKLLLPSIGLILVAFILMILWLFELTLPVINLTFFDGHIFVAASVVSFLLGIMLLCFHWRQILPFIIGAVVIALSLLVWRSLDLLEKSHIQRLVVLRSAQVKNEILSRMQLRLFALQGMARQWSAHDGTPQHVWRSDALHFIQQNEDFRTIKWVDQNNIIRWVEPSAGNGQLINKVISFDGAVNLSLQEAKKTGGLFLSGATEIESGGIGFLAYAPIYKQKKFDGFLMGVIGANALFDSMLRDNFKAGFNVVVKDHQKIIYKHITDSAIIPESWHKKIHVQIKGAKWEVTIWPGRTYLVQNLSYLPTLILFSGLFLALLLMVITRLTLLIQIRAKQLRIINEKLNQEIVKREEAEVSRRKLEGALQQSQKMQAIGTLAGGIAHDFNNILFSILGYTSLAQEDVSKDSVTYRNLGKVVEACKRGKDLVSRILAFSGKRSHHFTKLSLIDVVGSALELAKPGFKPEVNVVAKAGVKRARIVGDATQLQQVIVNLVNNAMHAIDNHGDIEIDIQKIKVDREFQELHPNLKQKRYFLLTVKDSGKGIEAETLSRVFEPFFTTKDVDQGTGLGLSTAHGIIGEHQGEIAVESEVGQGTMFSIWLPEFKG